VEKQLQMTCILNFGTTRNGQAHAPASLPAGV